MARLTFAVLIGFIAMGTPAYDAMAGVATISRHLGRRGPEPKQPDSQPTAQIPEALVKFNGKTIRILFEIDFPGEGTGELKTSFLTELLRAAGAKVVRMHTAEVQAKAGEIIVMGEVEVSRLPEDANPFDIEKHERGVSLFKTYAEHRKQLAADAAAAGAQVIDGGHIAAFFGLNSATTREFSLFVARDFQARFEGLLPEVKFEAVAVGDVIDYLRDVRDLSIFVNWRALATAGIDRQAPVTLNLHNVSCAKVLRLVLDSAGGGKAKLDYEIESGMLTISTAIDLFGDRVSRTYDIRFLLPETLEPAARDKRIAGLIELVVSSIDPPSWGAHPGKPCTIVEMKGELIVDQTEANQKSIDNLLKQLSELISLAHP